MEKQGLKGALLQRVKEDYEAAPEGSRRQRVMGGMLVAIMASPGAAMASSSVGEGDTGRQLLNNIMEFARSPFMIAMCIVAVILGVFMAIGGNIKAAFVPFGLAAIVAIGPWMVEQIFTAMGQGL